MKKQLHSSNKDAPVSEIVEKLGISRANVYVLKSKWKALQAASEPDSAEQTDDADEPTEWDVPVTVKTADLDKMIAKFTTAEKMEAVQTVLQGRINKLFDVESE